MGPVRVGESDTNLATGLTTSKSFTGEGTVKAGKRAQLTLAMLGTLAMPFGALAQTPSAPPAATADLNGLKTYMVEQAAAQKAGTATLVTDAQAYYELAQAVDFDYQELWDTQQDTLVPLLTEARETWSREAHGNYELNEGMVAGIPSLVQFDVLIDSGLSAEEDAANAVDYTIDLPDGSQLVKPGNLFHAVTEPALWGTDDRYVGLTVDFNGDGAMDVGEALPNANVLLGSMQALDAATAEMQTAISAWEPTLPDAFTALVVMIPTMSGYFEEWKLSSFVLGEESTQKNFVANSRLLDVLGILHGLEITWERVGPVVVASDPMMAEKIQREMNELIAFVQDLYDREKAGTRFTPEEADQFGAELQDRATALAGEITQSAAVLDIQIEA